MGKKATTDTGTKKKEASCSLMLHSFLAFLKLCRNMACTVVHTLQGRLRHQKLQVFCRRNCAPFVFVVVNFHAFSMLQVPYSFDVCCEFWLGTKWMWVLESEILLLIILLIKIQTALKLTWVHQHLLCPQSWAQRTCACVWRSHRSTSC